MSIIHQETYGSGAPLVMLHGWAMHSGVWRAFAERLASSRQVICLDLPGHGRSEPLAPFTLEAVASALLARIPVPEFTLLGWSLGGTLAMEMAALAPGRVKKLIVLAGNPHFLQSETWPGVKAATLDGFAQMLNTDVRQTLTRFLALQVNGLAHGRQLLQTLKEALQECEPPSAEVLQAGLEILKTSDQRELLLRNQVPVGMILGGRDTLVPTALAGAVRQINPALEVRVLEKAGHAPFLSHAETLADLIAEMA